MKDWTVKFMLRPQEQNWYILGELHLSEEWFVDAQHTAFDILNGLGGSYSVLGIEEDSESGKK